PVTTKRMDKSGRVPAHDYMFGHTPFFIKGNLSNGQRTIEKHLRIIQKLGQIRILGDHPPIKIVNVLFLFKTVISGQVAKIDGPAFYFGQSPISTPEIMESYQIIRKGVELVMGLYRQPGRS